MQTPARALRPVLTFSPKLILQSIPTRSHATLTSPSPLSTNITFHYLRQRPIYESYSRQQRQWRQSYSDSTKSDSPSGSALPPQTQKASNVPAKDDTLSTKKPVVSSRDDLTPTIPASDPLPAVSEEKLPEARDKVVPSPPGYLPERQESSQPNDGAPEALRETRVKDQLPSRAEQPSKSRGGALLAPRVTTSDYSPSENVSGSVTQRPSPAMDRLLESLANASQRLNIYTGTDYTPISSIRDSIGKQEALLKDLLGRINESKIAYDAAQSQQAGSQKEVVRLLERKNSWSADDLERYMALIRSEHEYDRAVTEAKETLDRAEWDLEEARTKLDKLEREQYHEEQVWSDTIRRNSTWVTMLLLGFNVLLLLGNVVIIEPWRRRRMVREVREALDEKTAITAAVGTATTLAPEAAEAAVDAGLHPPSDPPTLDGNDRLEIVQPVVAPAVDVLDASTEQKQLSSGDSVDLFPPVYWTGTWSGTWALYRAYWRDLFSEHRISIRRVDITTMVFEALAAGAACMGLVFVLLRPR